MAPPRSVDLTGFEVKARDEPVGRIHAATNEVDGDYVVVDAALQRVLLPAGLIAEVDEKHRTIMLTCTAAEVRGAPRFDEQHARLVDVQPEAEIQPAPAEEPTKDELLTEAGRLGVAGRSTMTKTELAEQLERLQEEKASPIEVQAFLDGVAYPVDRADLLKEAERHRARAEIRATLERLPDRRFEDPTDVSRAIGELP